jgi:hypothetical protein
MTTTALASTSQNPTASSSGTPTQVSQINYGFSPETAPYAQQLLGQAQALTDVNQNPYQQYQGETVAQFSPLQQQAFTNIGNMQAAPQLQDASALAGTAGLNALNTNYTYNPYQTQSFTSPGMAQSYMNPYVMNVLNPQLALLNQQQGAQQQTANAQAAQAGAFGGSRFGVQNAATNLNNQLAQQNTIGQGLYNAYAQGAQQFNTEQNASQAAANLNAQQSQFGANLGLQGLNTANQAATNLANIGNTQYQQNMAINQQQAQYGGVEQQQAQNMDNQAYQNFLNFQNYPYQQLNFMQNMIRGLPMTNQTAAVYQSPGSMLGQVAGLGIGAAAALKGSAEGGTVSSYKNGGHVKGYSGEDDQSLVQDRQVQPMFYAADNPMGASYKAGLDIPIGQNSNLTAGIGGSHIQGPNFKMDEHGGRHIGFGTDVGGGRLSLSHYEDPMTRYRENRLNYNMQFGIGGDVTDPTETEIYRMMDNMSDAQIQQMLQHPISMAEQQAAQQQMSFRGTAHMRDGGPVAFAEGGNNGLGVYSGGDIAPPSEAGMGIGKALGLPFTNFSQFVDFMTPSEPAWKKEMRLKDAGVQSKPSASAPDMSAYKPRSDVKSTDVIEAWKKPSADPKDHPLYNEARAVATNAGHDADDFDTSFDKILGKLSKGDEEHLKGINDLIASQLKEPERIKEEGKNQALMNFGFQMAAQAAQPGVAGNQGFAGLLRSAAAAGPEYAKSISDTDKMAADAKKLAIQLQVDQAKYQKSLDIGNKRYAVQIYQNMQDNMMKQQQLQEMITHNRRTEGIQAAHYAALSNNTPFKLAALKRQAMEMGIKQAANDYKNNPSLMMDKTTNQSKLAQQYANSNYADLMHSMTNNFREDPELQD